MSVGTRVSRRKLAEFVARGIQSGKGEDALTKAAAYLIETKQTRSVDLLVRDVEEMLAKDGVVVADITSARPLSKKDKDAVAELLGAKELHVREIIDPSVLGGLRVEITGKRLDATLKHKIELLKEIDSRKGTK
jgi:F-type H+-transporting ATPase subunit delta